MVLLCKGKFILIFTSINFSVLTKKSKPKDKLQVEELSPYLSVSILVYKPYYLFQYRINTLFFFIWQYLLSDPNVWSIHLTALLFRSLLEAESSRTVERSITQIQVNYLT